MNYVSIIIPTYNAVKCIDECIYSIRCDIVNYEILIGIDACKDTLEHCKKFNRVKLFYFPENVGPFIIKNSLINEAKYDNILFFDSDDILAEGTIRKFADSIQNKDFVQLSYIDFPKDKKYINLSSNKMNDAVIGIKKDVFNQLNGFYPWKCGADTEFTYRLKANGFKWDILGGISYYRRLHDQNLTVKKETGHGSIIRQKYMKEIQEKERFKYFPNPDIKYTSSYVVVSNSGDS